MKIYKAVVCGKSPYSQSKHHETPHLPGEDAPDYERRTWRNRMHVDSDGQVYIPPMQFKNCIAEAAKFLSIPIPGDKKKTYTKHFEAGVMVVTPVPLGIQADDVPGEALFVPSDGRRGGGSRESGSVEPRGES